MTNEEIDTRLKGLSKGIVDYATSMPPGVAKELELMNMSMMAITAMLGEIAKRLPEEKEFQC